MQTNSEVIKEAIYNNPTVLLNLNNNIVNDHIDSFLPFSMGFEFEADNYEKSSFKTEYFTSIPDIMNADFDYNEHRYRIPTGLKGLVCLFTLCETLKKHTILDLDSSIHYHTDLTDIYDNMIESKHYGQEIGSIQEKLKEWGTAKNLDSINGWCKLNSLKTLEIRIGEPTYDYSIIIKRVFSCTEIARDLKIKYGSNIYRLENLNKKLEQLRTVSAINNTVVDFNKVVKSRVSYI